MAECHRDLMDMHPCNRDSECAIKKVSFLTPFLEEQGGQRAPWRFQWLIKRRLCVMAWPQYPEHLRWLLKNGVRRLVCTSPECRPPTYKFTEFYYLELPIEELKPPTLEQVKLFICFCEQARQMDEAVGIHCRVGRGRSGTLAACYLVRYCGLTAEQAITQLRRVRPYSVDSLEQEKVIKDYYAELCQCRPEDACWQPEKYAT